MRGKQDGGQNESGEGRTAPRPVSEPAAHTLPTMSATNVLRLQRSAGNRAVQRRLRTTLRPSTGAGAAGSRGPVVQRESLTWRSPNDTFVLDVGGRKRTLTRPQTQQYTRRLNRVIGERLMDGLQAMSDYNDHVRLGRDRQGATGRGIQGRVGARDSGNAVSDFFHMLVSTVSEGVGGVDMPGPEIYQGAQQAFERMARLSRDGDYVGAFNAGPTFERAFNQGAARWRRFVAQAGQGAQSTADTLEIVRDVSFAVAAAAATGGMAAAFQGATIGGMVVGQGAAGAMAAAVAGGGTAVVGASTRELGEFIASGDTAVDWDRGAEEILAGAASGAFSGAVGHWMKGAVSSQLFQARWFQQLVARAGMAADRTNPLLRRGVIGVSKYLSDHAAQLVAATATTIFTAGADAARELRSRQNLSMSDFLDAVWGKLRSAGYAEILWRAIAARHGVSP